MAKPANTTPLSSAQQQPEPEHPAASQAAKPARRPRRPRQPTLDQGRAFIDACLAPLPSGVTPVASRKFLTTALSDASEWWEPVLQEVRAIERGLIPLLGELALTQRDGGDAPPKLAKEIDDRLRKLDVALEKLMRIPAGRRRNLRWKEGIVEDLKADHPLRRLVKRDRYWLAARLEG